MTEIRAFVGHSFTEGDAGVVRRFLDYFATLSNSGLNFSWEHAETAEPKLVAEKVMTLLSDKNVFIGICTKKERVVQQSSLKKSIFFPRGDFRVNENDLSWKTSDWIIQEIGLAKGMGRDLILLLENDVQKPGGLQGDFEYIPFDRQSPERSFGKILQMINSLSPKPAQPMAISSDTELSSEDEEIERETSTDDLWTTPKPEWGRRQYEIAFMHTMAISDDDNNAAIDQAYLATEHSKKEDKENSWKAFCQLTRIHFGKGGSLQNLQALAKSAADSSETLRYLAQGYENYQDYVEAAKTYEAAASKTTDKLMIVTLLGKAAENYSLVDLPEKVLVTVSRMKAQAKVDGNGEQNLLTSLKPLAEKAKANENSLAIMERIVELNPSDTSTRFSLAYLHSECGNKDLALLHYLKIPTNERSSATWNNLGVTFEHFSLPAKSVDAYRAAKDMGETLAMSNLAMKFISAGFLSDAKEQCDEALAIEDFHKNLGGTLAKLANIPEEESDKEAKLLEKAKPKSDFYRKFGRAVSHPDLKELAERWEGPDCVLDVRLKEGTFSASGSYEQQVNGLASALFASPSTSGLNPPVKYDVGYNGRIRGHTIEARVTRDRVGEPRAGASLLSLALNEIETVMVLADDGNEIHVMEKPSSGDPRFYSLKRETTNTA